MPGRIFVFKLKYLSGCRINVDIMTAEKFSSIYLAYMELIYWSVSSSSRRRGDGVKGVNFSQCPGYVKVFFLIYTKYRNIKQKSIL